MDSFRVVLQYKLKAGWRLDDLTHKTYMEYIVYAKDIQFFSLKEASLTFTN